jgi:hypothetical protein
MTKLNITLENYSTTLKLKNKEGKVKTEREWAEYCEKNDYYLDVNNAIRSNFKRAFVMQLEVVEDWDNT